MASAASLSEANPPSPELMNSRMRSIPSGLLRGVISTMTRPFDTTRSDVPSANMAATPPRDAPTRTGGRAQPISHRHAVGGVGRERVVAVQGPLAVAVTAEVERHRSPSPAGDDLGRSPHAWRVWPPPCISSTGQAPSSPNTSATRWMPSKPSTLTSLESIPACWHGWPAGRWRGDWRRCGSSVRHRWRRPDSNRRPAGCKPAALPTELRPRAAPALLGRCRTGPKARN